MRLSVFIAKSGYASRRKADLLIKEGKVAVNRKVIRQPFYSVNIGDAVAVEGKIIKPKDFSYVILNKPKGVTTTRQDRFASSKVIDFLAPELRSLYPVGRLDKNSTGLLILTNDGKLCYELTHPKFEIEKEYLVLVAGKIGPKECRAAKRGVVDEGERLGVKRIRVLRRGADESLCGVVVCEGKKRHLRRLFRALGLGVKALKRIRIGGLVLGALREGKYKSLNQDKIYSLVFKKARLD
jgi:pseudouridine synthase